MGDESRREGSRFDSALDRIRVVERLGPEWADRVGGLTVTSATSDPARDFCGMYFGLASNDEKVSGNRPLARVPARRGEDAGRPVALDTHYHAEP